MYPNKELIIVTAGKKMYRESILSYVNGLFRDDIHVFFVPEERGNLGVLRNASLDQATGDIICQWDDDDLNHPLRLQSQYNEMMSQKAVASFLTNHFQFFHNTKDLYWIDWTAGGQIQGKMQQMPATVMMFKDERFRYVDRPGGGEDSEFRDLFHDQIEVANISNFGHLFVYQFHGQNILSEDHHRHIASFGTVPNLLGMSASKVFSYLEYYSLPRPFDFKDGNDNVLTSFF